MRARPAANPAGGRRELAGARPLIRTRTTAIGSLDAARGVASAVNFRGEGTVEYEHEHKLARRLKVLSGVLFALGWVGAFILAVDDDTFRSAVATLITYGAQVTLASAALLGVATYVGRPHDMEPR